MSELIQILPVVALRGMTILPDMVIHFDVSRERSVRAIEQAMLREQRLFLVTQKNTQAENPGMEDLYRIGTIAVVKQVIKLPHKIWMFLWNKRLGRSVANPKHIANLHKKTPPVSSSYAFLVVRLDRFIPHLCHCQ